MFCMNWKGYSHLGYIWSSYESLLSLTQKENSSGRNQQCENMFSKFVVRTLQQNFFSFLPVFSFFFFPFEHKIFYESSAAVNKTMFLTLFSRFLSFYFSEFSIFSALYFSSKISLWLPHPHLQPLCDQKREEMRKSILRGMGMSLLQRQI